MSRRSSERGRGDAGRERPDHRRLAVADEAARILAEEGQTDFRAAKAKAAERLGLGRNVPLPSNVEVAAALAERQRGGRGQHQAERSEQQPAAMRADQRPHHLPYPTQVRPAGLDSRFSHANSSFFRYIRAPTQVRGWRNW